MADVELGGEIKRLENFEPFKMMQRSLFPSRETTDTLRVEAF